MNMNMLGPVNNNLNTMDAYGNYYYPVPQYYPMVHSYEPQFCTGKAHVFECDHVDKCKCGRIQRVMPK